jgi:hypothetical protein
MPRLGVQPTIPLFERAKTFHTLDRAATVIGKLLITNKINYRFMQAKNTVLRGGVFS